MTCQNGADDGSAPWMTIGGRRQAEGQWKGSVGSDEDSKKRVDPLPRERGGVKKGRSAEKRTWRSDKERVSSRRKDRAPSGCACWCLDFRRVSWPCCVCLTSVGSRVLLARSTGPNGRQTCVPLLLVSWRENWLPGGCERSWAYTKEVDATRNNTAVAGWS